MTYSEQMLRTHPRRGQGSVDALATAIDACYDCAETCAACADACLGEDKVQNLTRCIRLNLDCADICATMARVLSRQTGADPDTMNRQLEACLAIVRACATECEKHAGKHEHCRICAESCRQCEAAMRELAAAGFSVTS